MQKVELFQNLICVNNEWKTSYLGKINKGFLFLFIFHALLLSCSNIEKVKMLFSFLFNILFFVWLLDFFVYFSFTSCLKSFFHILFIEVDIISLDRVQENIITGLGFTWLDINDKL